MLKSKLFKIIIITITFLVITFINLKSLDSKIITGENLNMFIDPLKPKNLGIDEYYRFLHDIGKRESGNNYENDRNMPYWGYYQIGPLTRKTLKLNVSWNLYKRNCSLQDYVMYSNLKYNDKRIGKKYFEYFIGKKIKKIEITYSGLLAGAHIGGGGGIRSFLYSNGEYDPADNLGTKISNYVKLFAGYNFNIDSIEVKYIK